MAVCFFALYDFCHARARAWQKLYNAKITLPYPKTHYITLKYTIIPKNTQKLQYKK